MCWRGPEWIKSRVSQVRIERMRRDDRVITYQAKEGVLGFAHLASSGYKGELSDRFDTFDLAARGVIRLVLLSR